MYRFAGPQVTYYSSNSFHATADRYDSPKNSAVAQFFSLITGTYTVMNYQAWLQYLLCQGSS